MTHPEPLFTGTTENAELQGSRVARASSSLASPAAPPPDCAPFQGRAASGSALDILEDLRRELDHIDRALLESLRQRLDCCMRIGAHKKIHDIPMMQPQRIGVVQQRAADFAAANRLNPSFLHALYALIIEETCRLEDEVIGTREPL